MNIAVAISPIIKVLVPDRDERDLAMCHKIHRVVRLLRIHWLLYSSAPACALRVLGKHGVPVDGVATAVLARAWCFCAI